jgi:guanosine-3',5'-bis(diphosphate) 3'-pyrophosphohydrolase
MAIARPETPVSSPPGSLATPPSETGMELEATPPVAPPYTPAPAPLSQLDEPSGLLTPLPSLEDPTPDPLSGYADLDAKFKHLLATVRANRPSDDLNLIRGSWAFCIEKHATQKRASGEPYIGHPLAVGQVLAELKMDATAIAAGLLHDAVEDTDVTAADIAKRFGEQVAHIVEGVTKLDKIKFANREDHQAENIRKMLLAMVTDLRVVIIKLADRLHNMRTLEHLRPDKQQRIARETLEVYAPLAHRLGMGKLRGELEDLAFRYIDPFAYTQLSVEVDSLRGEGEAFLQRIVINLEAKLREAHIKAKVESRIKRLYSIQQKLIAHAIPVDQVFDLFAVRVITETEAECYAALGLLHSAWRPVPGRFKDFIAMPRPNLYQSLHTTLIAEGGHQFEVQIRTEDMHRVAEEGIAAHWKYKATDAVTAKDEQRLAWVRQLMEWQREMTDPNEFMSTLRIDLYPEEVYTFTPKGKVIVLPKDASPIDFAYAIHTDVGHATVGAKVNGRIVPLRSRLRNGDIVEITTQTGHAPSRDWLSFTKSSRARNKIKHWLSEHQRERAIEIGQKLLQREARKYKISLERFKPADYDRIAQEYGLQAEQDLLAAIGFGKYSTRQAARCLPMSTSPQPAQSGTHSRTCPRPSSASSSARAPNRSRSKARTICSSTARDAATPSAAKRSSATSPAARVSPCTPAAAPTSRTCSTKLTAASKSSGPPRRQKPPQPRPARPNAPPIPCASSSTATTAPAC